MTLWDRLKEFFGGSGSGTERPAEEAEPPPPAVDPLGTTPGPIAGAMPPVTPPSAPRRDDS